MRPVVQLDGVEDLEAALAELSTAAHKEVLRRALARAAKPIAQAMSDFAPVHSGGLSDSPRIEGDVRGGVAGRRAYAEVMRTGGSKAQAQQALRAANKANPREFQARADIGPAKGQGGHAHLVEFGTGPRYHKSGKYVGVMPADPFVRPAWDAQGGAAASNRIRDELVAELNRTVARIAAREAKSGS